MSRRKPRETISVCGIVCGRFHSTGSCGALVADLRVREIAELSCSQETTKPCFLFSRQNVGGTPVPQGDWSKLKLKQASSKNKKKKKEALTKHVSKREGLHDCLEIWPVRKHAILNSNINILSRELQMQQKK
ncbi:hypothetical protein CY35_12G115000 [Sphagnum magellanicum]|nr:hypothetical protein CY35_12G115000 [Sphagnum magellanicum]